jgi:hypothetical protein
MQAKTKEDIQLPENITTQLQSKKQTAYTTTSTLKPIKKIVQKTTTPWKHKTEPA